jgi:hypothetical protein
MASSPNSANMYLGAGSVLFDRFDSLGASTGLRHLGNVESLTINHSVEKVTKKSAMSAARATYAESVTGTSANLSMVLNEFTPENLALATLGNNGIFTQDAEATVTDRPVGPAAAAVKLDTWYDIGSITPTITTVKQGATTLNAAAYEVNAESGMIRLLSSYTGANKAEPAVAITWTGSVPAITAATLKGVVYGLASGIINGRLRYISAPDQTQGPRVMLDVWKVGLTPDGDIGLITDDFGTFTVGGEVSADMGKPDGQQYYRVIYL